MTPRWKKINLIVYLLSFACMAETIYATARQVNFSHPKGLTDFWILLAIVGIPAILFFLLYPFEQWWLGKISPLQKGIRLLVSIVFFILRLVGFVFFAMFAILMNSGGGFN